MFGNAANGISASATPSDIRMIMLKLRWIGLEDEAEILHQRLKTLAPGQCVAMEPPDTD
jgi:hypothetical protein